MKKILLTITAFTAMALSVNAQQRTSLYEEFTGENCGPCAATNPGLWTLLNTAPNPTKIIDLSYMEPIPSSGWFYMQDQAVSDARLSYYSSYYGSGEFAPSGIQDGHIPDGDSATPMHPYYFNQHDIDSMYAIASPFNVTVTNSWDATYSNIISVITVTNASTTTTYAPSGANFYLRLALTETVDFATAPGDNGETHFNDVVREMFPNATGTSLPASWGPGVSQTYTVTGACPSYVDKSKSPFMVAWVQNDNGKAVEQAAKGTPLPGIPNDAGLNSSTGPTGLICHANSSYSVVHSVVLQNAGTSTLTSATIYYSIDGGTLASYAWTGSLAATATTSVTMPGSSITITGAQYHTIYDSVAMPNATTDQNPNNNVAQSSFFIESTVGLAMPYSTSFETADLGKFYMESLSADGANWGIFNNGTGTSLAHSGVNAALWECYAFAVGDQAIITLPEVTTSSPSYINFWVAYAQYSGTETDQLEVVYSSDCGSTWTSLWSASGSSLATVAATTSLFVPTSPSQYAEHSVAVSTIPSGSILAFRGTSDYGNNIWLDDINISSTTSINNVITQSSLDPSIYPNPAKDEATLSFNLVNSSDVTIQVIDGLGRIVNVVANDKMDAGQHSVIINTASLASGIYNVMIHTENGTFTERLSVAK